MNAAPYITRDDARHPEHRHVGRAASRRALRQVTPLLVRCLEGCRCGATRTVLVRVGVRGDVSTGGARLYHAGPWEAKTP